MHWKWSRWRAFPCPRKGGHLNAPFGPGVYELRNRATGEMVYGGKGKHVGKRMLSLLPPPHGWGKRNNMGLREYVELNLADIEYRTKACATDDDAKAEERRFNKYEYVFPT